MADNEESIHKAVQQRFDTVAKEGAQGHFAYPVGEAGLTGLGYAKELTALIPDTVRQRFCGTGHMLGAAQLQPGQRVLDMGCGCGLDSLLAAVQIGPRGLVLAVDRSLDMLKLLAKGYSSMVAEGPPLAPLLPCQASAEELPLPNASVDCILSNGLFSLLPHKEKTLAHMHRVLTPGGQLVLADQTRCPLATPSNPNATATSAQGWAL